MRLLCCVDADVELNVSEADYANKTISYSNLAKFVPDELD
jgi:hypothetical protein